MNSAGGVMRSAGRAQIIGLPYPDPAFEGRETPPHPLGPAHGLRAAGNLAVSEIRLNQIDQRSAGLTRIRRRQGMRENPRLNLIARRGIAEHSAFASIEH